MENQIILSQKNCHRAAKVRQIEHPEYGEFDFEWRGKRVDSNFLHSEFSHVATAPEFGDITLIADVNNAMKSWEVVSWKYELNFENLWDLAVRAFDGTSFSPDKRAAQYIQYYEAVLNDDLTNIPDDEQARYIDKFTEWVHTLFDKHSRCLSSMITGAARFPTRRNEKANNSYETAVNEFGEWRERVQKAIARRIEDAKPAEKKASEEWEAVKRDIDTHYLPTNLYNRMETIARRGNTVLIEKAIEYVRELNAQRPRPIFTERHKFFKLIDVAKAVQSTQAARENMEDVELLFDGGKVVKNFSEDRLQIIFEGKPAPDVISNLKHNGFRWSPRFVAWQRQLTSNAYYATARVIPVAVEQLKAM